MNVARLYMANCDWDENTILTIIDAFYCKEVYKGFFKDMPRRVEKKIVRTFGDTTIVVY